MRKKSSSQSLAAMCPRLVFFLPVLTKSGRVEALKLLSGLSSPGPNPNRSRLLRKSEACHKVCGRMLMAQVWTSR
ncbi:MAG: hypothetical protein J3Q66DRAFT_333903 [Benniella sp.]|nr:MAG: hypothetical protein J3Q66DRAFT_333903 [Benniella sp.]